MILAAKLWSRSAPANDRRGALLLGCQPIVACVPSMLDLAWRHRAAPYLWHILVSAGVWPAETIGRVDFFADRAIVVAVLAGWGGASMGALACYFAMPTERSRARRRAMNNQSPRVLTP
jgi:hypothetical protein